MTWRTRSTTWCDTGSWSKRARVKIIAEISQHAETKQLCKGMIDYIKVNDRESDELGFKADTKEEITS